jgi:hypothetical protein
MEKEWHAVSRNPRKSSPKFSNRQIGRKVGDFRAFAVAKGRAVFADTAYWKLHKSVPDNWQLILAAS